MSEHEILPPSPSGACPAFPSVRRPSTGIKGDSGLLGTKAGESDVRISITPVPECAIPHTFGSAMPSYPISAANAATETTPLLAEASASQFDLAGNSALSIHLVPNVDHGTIIGELKVLVSYLTPIMGTQFLEFTLFSVAIASTGKLGVLELAAASLGFLMTNLFSFSIIQGMTSALDTLCPQAYASSYPKQTSLHAMRTFVILLILNIPQITIFWWSEEILLAMQQDPEVARLAGLYLRTVSFGLPAYSAFECIRRWLQAQGRLLILVVTLFIAALLNIVLNVLLVWGPEPIRLGFVGAPLATVISLNSMCVVTLIYSIWFCPHDAWGGVSMATFTDLGENIRLGLAGTAMVASEWWCWEIFYFGASYLGPTTLAAHSVLVTTQGFMFQPQYALSVAVSIRVGNLLGAQRPHIAKKAAHASVFVVTGMALISSTALLTFRDTFARVFTNDVDVGILVSQVVPLLALFQLTDGVLTAFNGVLRGSGRSALGAGINLVGYYVLALPLGLGLTFLGPKLGLRGIWIGISSAIGCTAILTSYFIWYMDWDSEADKAWARTQPKRMEDIDEADEEV